MESMYKLIQDRVFFEVEEYFVANQFKTRILDDLLAKCAKMTDDLTELYIDQYIEVTI
jgi:hypothetical protein